MYRAVYRDGNGCTYSAPLELHKGQWLMRTNQGLQNIPYVFHDDVGGRLLFESFREDQPAPPEPNTKLHVEGQGFRALQEAGARATVQYQTQREQKRLEILDALNEQNAEKIAEARAHATALAQLWNPKRPEPIPPTQLTKEHLADAEHSRFRKGK